MDKGKNYLNRSGMLTLLVLGILLLLYFLPRFNVGGRTLRRIDLLSDVRPKSPQVADTLVIDSFLPPPPKPAFVDTCRTGMECIEDYQDSTLRGMTPFYLALEDLVQHPRPVRIAYFGDSFIEGDILTADLRSLLQQEYGGSGVGYIPVTSFVSGFRMSVREKAGGWYSHAITDSVYFNRQLQDISNHYFIPRSGAYAEFSGSSHYAGAESWQQSSIFFVNHDSLSLDVSLGGSDPITHQFDSIGHLQVLSSHGRTSKVRWTVQKGDSAIFHGIALEDTVGISLDNFSLRGSSGLSIRSIPMATLRQFAHYRPYDLIILQFGVNVATQRGSDYTGYVNGMRTVIEHLKSAFPTAGILIVGVADRDYVNDEGEILTMPGIRNLVRFQQRLASDECVAFWNLFQAMGGNESMKDLVNRQPSLAALDYTHINGRGGRYLAGLFFDALQYGYQQFERRRAYENE